MENKDGERLFTMAEVEACLIEIYLSSASIKELENFIELLPTLTTSQIKEKARSEDYTTEDAENFRETMRLLVQAELNKRKHKCTQQAFH